MVHQFSWVFGRWRVWSFGFVIDLEYPYVGIGLGPIVIRWGIDRELE